MSSSPSQHAGGSNRLLRRGGPLFRPPSICHFLTQLVARYGAVDSLRRELIINLCQHRSKSRVLTFEVFHWVLLLVPDDAQRAKPRCRHSFAIADEYGR